MRGKLHRRPAQQPRPHAAAGVRGGCHAGQQQLRPVVEAGSQRPRAVRGKERGDGGARAAHDAIQPRRAQGGTGARGAALHARRAAGDDCEDDLQEVATIRATASAGPAPPPPRDSGDEAKTSPPTARMPERTLRAGSGRFGHAQ
ncbi:hypothetical protein TSOC_001303 [Tetrabaena socialis]|uniref:Uncharacterized protein n=1 Tax=Tetrabaena socialis TaxID=47790 RepID=A0A2J8AH22_9CHLO|nr:hypothetical protein TSOC_001303 [Tetrabaena socialis]|eukprot:PNH11810.1 hypothetical protein TSOC_001303 [Tetrabaena socialis]